MEFFCKSSIVDVRLDSKQDSETSHKRLSKNVLETTKISEIATKENLITYLVLDGLMQLVSLHMNCHVFLNEFKIAYLNSVFCSNSRFRTFNSLSANPTKWSNTLKQLPTNCLSLFDYFVGLLLKRLRIHRLNFHLYYN